MATKTANYFRTNPQVNPSTNINTAEFMIKYLENEDVEYIFGVLGEENYVNEEPHFPKLFGGELKKNNKKCQK